MKKIIIALIIFVLITTGCSKDPVDNAKNNEETPSSTVNLGMVDNITEKEEIEKIQQMIDSFYYNPVIDENTNYNFFENDEKLLEFAAHYKKEYNIENSLLEIVESVFGLKLNSAEMVNENEYSTYDYSEKGKYLPVVEGVYQNQELLIVKAGLYSLAEDESSEKKNVGMITATFEKNAEPTSYYLIDYNYEKIITEEGK